VVEGNRIGTDADGTSALPNSVGINISESATNNMIGGTTSGSANLISGNVQSGVSISQQGTSNNVVEGNRIGTTADGTAALPNKYGG
jgi:titin